MTALAEAAPAAIGTAAGPDETLARWSPRAAAIAIDVLPGAGVCATAAVVERTVPILSPWWYVAISIGGAAILATAINRTIVPGVTGFSLGRSLMGVRVVTRDGGRVGAGRLLIRDLAHLLDTAAFLIGWFWPLWDRRRRTFADLVTRTEVRSARPRGSTRIRRDRTAAVVLSAALISVSVAAMANLVAYRPDRLSDQAHSQLQRQGPKAVAEMLSFNPKTLKDDFARAQSLATDKYLPELVTVQQQVAKSPTPHEYWVPECAVLSATTDRATMLMFLQGQTGDPPNIRPISATVKVGLAKSGDRWLVDALTFVPPPKKPEARR